MLQSPPWRGILLFLHWNIESKEGRIYWERIVSYNSPTINLDIFDVAWIRALQYKHQQSQKSLQMRGEELVTQDAQ